MFVMTVINFLLFSLEFATRLVVFIDVAIRKAIIVDIYYPLPGKGKVVNDALKNLNIILLWSGNLPVRNNLLLLNSVSINTRWRYYSAI